MRALVAITIFFATNICAAHAFPDGAPWGSADPEAVQNCASCHFDGSSVRDSEYIRFVGLGPRLEPSKTYILALTFAKPEAPAAGFLVKATAGEFISPDDSMLEANGSQLRSLSVKRDGERTNWLMQWRAPDVPLDKVTFFIAVNAGNDDQSSFGDEIHFKTVTFAAE